MAFRFWTRIRIVSGVIFFMQATMDEGQYSLEDGNAQTLIWPELAYFILLNFLKIVGLYTKV